MNKGFIFALAIAVVIVGGAIGLIWKFQPSHEEQKRIALEGAVREDSPEFPELTKRIIAETNGEKTWESPIGTGYMMMNIAGRIKNYSGKTLSGLEVKVSVNDQLGKTVRDKTVIVVPIQQSTLEPGGVMDVVVRIDGFSPDDDRAQIRWKVTAIKTQ